MRKVLACVAALSALAAASPGDASAQSRPGVAAFASDDLTIRSSGRSHDFRVELAISARQQAQGLMFRRHLPADAGMLFVYRSERPVSMWMRNTFIPLDMVFIGGDGRIRKIVERTVPLSETVIPSGGPVIAVLELNAGTASRLNIRPGDRVVSSALSKEGG